MVVFPELKKKKKKKSDLSLRAPFAFVCDSSVTCSDDASCFTDQTAAARHTPPILFSLPCALTCNLGTRASRGARRMHSQQRTSLAISV